MKKKRYYLIFTFFIMFVLCVAPTKALEIIVDDYESLKTAIADSTITEIVLSKDISVTEDPGLTVASTRNIVIDLNGNVLSMNSSNASTSYLINNKGNLTIKDSTDTNHDGTGNGKITYSSSNPDTRSIPGYASNTITNSGVLIIESGIIENSTDKAPAAYVIDNNSSGNDAIVTINGGKVNNINNWGIRMFVNNNTKTNDITINNGYINGGVWMQTLKSQPKANFVVNNGTIKGNNYGFYIYDPSTDGSNINTIINGGNFIANSETGYAIYIYDTNSNVEINGGTFDGAYALIYFTYNKSELLTHIINDGVFNGYVEFDEKFKTNPDEEFTTNFKINDGKFLNDLYVWGHDGSDWYLSSNTKFIYGGVFADIIDAEDDCAWPNLIVNPYVATGKMKSTPVGYPYTIGHKITLNSNYDNEKNSTIYTLKDGSMTELEDIKRNGYQFLGWNTKQDGTGIEITKDSKLNKETTLFAQWKEVINLNNLFITINNPEELIYNESEVIPSITIKKDNKVLNSNEFIITSDGITNAGKQTYTLSLKDDSIYILENGTSKTRKFNATIIPKTISNVKIEIDNTSYIFTGKEIKPDVNVKTDENTISNDNYDVIYEENINVGTGKIIVKNKTNSNYIYNASTTFEIIPKIVTSPTLEMDSLIYEYTGKEVTPNVIIKDEEGNIIDSKNYIITYKDNTEVGLATMIIKSKSGANYSFSFTKNFEIRKSGILENTTSTDNFGGATLDNSDYDLAEKIPLTIEEIKMKSEGKNIYVFLEVNDLENNAVETTEKKLIEDKLDEDVKVGVYLDINLYKQIDGESKTKITETNGKIKASFELPERLRNTDDRIKREYYIIKVHNGVTEILDVTVDGSIVSFETDEFSTYVLLYKDIVTTNPKTGDNVIFYILVLGLSIIGFNSTQTYLKKKRFN